MTDPRRTAIDDVADAEDRGDVVDQQTAAEAGIDRAPAADTGATESEAHPS